MDELTLRAIGVVHSPVGEGDEMPIEGVAAQAEVHADYAEGLHDIESNTHVYVLGWLHRASQALLASEPARGVFGLRSPARPNPIGLSAAKLLRPEGRMLPLDRLDMFDGTPVLDIKRYSPGWDCVFSARKGPKGSTPRYCG